MCEIIVSFVVKNFTNYTGLGHNVQKAFKTNDGAIYMFGLLLIIKQGFAVTIAI